jgi:hypothetical protein
VAAAPIRRAALSLGFLGALLLPLPAEAGVQGTVKSRLLEVTADARDNRIVVKCVGGAVRVNGQPPGGGPPGCRRLTGLLISTYRGDDTVSLQRVGGSFSHRLRTLTFLGPGTDSYVGSGKRFEAVAGGGGNDRMVGRGGQDVMRGNAGDDFLFGGAGDDLLFGSRGHDVLAGGLGSDRLHGQQGRDAVNGGPGRDVQRP